MTETRSLTPVLDADARSDNVVKFLSASLTLA